jgi:RNA polymerase sigma-70 factor, ECF subfamily
VLNDKIWITPLIIMKDLSGLTDEEVVVFVRTKDKNEYAEIIKRYQVKLMRYAVNIIGDDHMAADVVQEGLMKAYVSLNSFSTKKKFSSWIYRIVHNEAINMLRKNSKQQPIADMDFDSGINLEDEVIKKELIEHANFCLKQVPIKYREPLSLYFLEEKSYEEIGDILKIPIGTVGTRINRGKMFMKKICQKQRK